KKDDDRSVVADCNKAIELDPNDGVAYRLRAAALANLGDLGGAIDDANKAIALRPGDALAYNARGVARKNRGEFREAIADFSDAIQIDGGYATALGNLASVLATASDRSVRDGPRALKYAVRACQLTNWRNPVLINDVAAAYAESRQFESAVE